MAIAKVSIFAITAPCTPDIGSLSREENAANARLIAAAPDLLAALKAVAETDDDCPMCDRGRLRNPQKTHWPECPYGRAQSLIVKVESDRPVEPYPPFQGTDVMDGDEDRP
jgi:hypothetical protein